MLMWVLPIIMLTIAISTYPMVIVKIPIDWVVIPMSVFVQ